MNSAYNKQTNNMNKIRKVGCALFALMCIASVYKIAEYNLASNRNNGVEQTDTLLLVNMFTRHGDRAPSEFFHPIDSYRKDMYRFWPDGKSNLNDVGRSRMYRMGMELRQTYDSLIGFETNRVAVYSSDVPRCVNSAEFMLRGLYELEIGRQIGRQYKSMCLFVHDKTNASENYAPKCKSLGLGDGTINAIKNITIDTKSLPSLNYKYINNCKFSKQSPNLIDADLMRSPDVRALPGVDALARVIKRRYDLPFTETCLYLYFNIVCEFSLYKTQSTIGEDDHYSDWMSIPVEMVEMYEISATDPTRVANISRAHRDALARSLLDPIRLFDVFEAVNVYAYRDRVYGPYEYAGPGPILTSIIESQLSALGQHNSSSARMSTYAGKKLLLYNTHDTVIQKMLWLLGVIDDQNMSYTARFHKHAKGTSLDTNMAPQLMAGISMSAYGASVRFELWRAEVQLPEAADDAVETHNNKEQFAYVTAQVYSNDDGRLADIDFQDAQLGSACRRTFKKMYSNASDTELAKYYSSNVKLDSKTACPFELLRNITARLMIDDDKLSELCGA